MPRSDLLPDEAGSSIAAPLPRVGQPPPAPTPSQWVNQTNTSGRAVEPWQAEDRTAYIQAKQQQMAQQQAEQTRQALLAEQNAYQMRQAARNQFLENQNLVAQELQRRTGTNPLNVIPQAAQVASVVDQENARARQALQAQQQGSAYATFANPPANDQAWKETLTGQIQHHGGITGGLQNISRGIEAAAAVPGRLIGEIPAGGLPGMGGLGATTGPTGVRVKESDPFTQALYQTAAVGAATGGLGAVGVPAAAINGAFAAVGANEAAKTFVQYQQGQITAPRALRDILVKSGPYFAPMLLEAGFHFVNPPADLLNKGEIDLTHPKYPGQKLRVTFNPATKEFEFTPTILQQVQGSVSRAGGLRPFLQKIVTEGELGALTPGREPIPIRPGEITPGAIPEIPQTRAGAAAGAMDTILRAVAEARSITDPAEKARFMQQQGITRSMEQLAIDREQMQPGAPTQLPATAATTAPAVPPTQFPRPMGVTSVEGGPRYVPQTAPNLEPIPTDIQGARIVSTLRAPDPAYNAGSYFWRPDSHEFVGGEGQLAHHRVEEATQQTSKGLIDNYGWVRVTAERAPGGGAFGLDGRTADAVQQAAKDLIDGGANPDLTARFDVGESNVNRPSGETQLADIASGRAFGGEKRIPMSARLVPQLSASPGSFLQRAINAASNPAGEGTPAHIQPWLNSYVERLNPMTASPDNPDNNEIVNDIYDRMDVIDGDDSAEKAARLLDEAGTLQLASNGDRQLAIINDTDQQIFPTSYLKTLGERAYMQDIAVVSQKLYRALHPFLRQVALKLGPNVRLKTSRFAGISLHEAYGFNMDLRGWLEKADLARDDMREFRKATVWQNPFVHYLSNETTTIALLHQPDQSVAGLSLPPEAVLREIVTALAADSVDTLIHEAAHNFLVPGTPLGSTHDELFASAVTALLGNTRQLGIDATEWFTKVWWDALTGPNAKEFYRDLQRFVRTRAIADELAPDFAADTFELVSTDIPFDELPRAGISNRLPHAERALPQRSPGDAGGAGGGGGQPPANVPGAGGPTEPGLPEMAPGPVVGGAFPPAPTVRTPDLSVTPAEELQARRGEASGMFVRKLGELAVKAEDLLSGGVEKRISPVRAINSWFTTEHARLSSPMAMAVGDWRRNYKAIQPWAHEVGKIAQTKLGRAFGINPNAVFKAPDGQPIFYKAPNGKSYKLTNADVVENYQLYPDRMTPEQTAAAQELGDYVKGQQAAARAVGTRLGDVNGIDGSEVGSYVHRTVTSVLKTPGGGTERIYANEFGDSSVNRGAGVKISEQNPRDYVTRAEGIAAGNRYLNNWAEEYASHVAKLKRREADVALKQTTDRLLQTISQRVDEMSPGLREGLVKARDEERLAKSLLNQRIRQVNRRAVLKAQKELTLARRAVERAERRLAQETIAPKLLGKRRDALVRQVGMAREKLAEATRELKASNEGAVESLKGKYPETDRQILAAAKEKLRTAEERRKGLRRDVAEARRAAKADTTREKYQPGGLPIVAGRIAKMEDAQWLEKLREEPSRPIFGDLVQNLSQPMRWIMATLDVSAIGNQSWNLLMLNSPAFGMTIYRSLVATLAPSQRARYLRERPDLARFLQTYAPEVWDANPDFDPRGNLVATGAAKGERLPVVGRGGGLLAAPFRLADAQFRNMRTLAAMALADTFMQDGLTEDEKHDLGSAILKLAGVARTVGPEKGGLFAASFVRSQIGLGMDAITNGGVQGHVARTLFMKLWVKAALATLMFALFVEGERDRDKLLKKVEPWQPNSFQIAGISLLGPWRPLFVAMSTLGAAGADAATKGDWGGLLKEIQSQPENYLRGKLTPVLSKTLNSLLGENAIGQPTSFQNEFFNLKSFAPLSIQQSRQDIAQGNPKALSIFAALTGLRYLPDTAREKVENKLDTLGYTQADVDRFWGESNYRKEQIAKHAELGKAYDDYEAARRVGSVDQRQAQKIVDDSRAAVQGKIDQLRSGTGTPVDVKDFVKDQISQVRLLRDALLPGGQSDSRFAPLYQAYDDAVDPQTKEVDFDKASAAQEAYLKDHPELRADWEKQQYITLTNDPAEKQLADARRLINKPVTMNLLGKKQPISYYGSDQVFWDAARKAIGITDHRFPQYDSVDAFVADATRKTAGTGQDSADIINKNPLYTKFIEYRSLIRQTMIAQNPRLGAALSFWYGVNLPNKLPTDTLNKVGAEKKKISQDVYGR